MKINYIGCTLEKELLSLYFCSYHFVWERVEEEDEDENKWGFTAFR